MKIKCVSGHNLQAHGETGSSSRTKDMTYITKFTSWVNKAIVSHYMTCFTGSGRMVSVKQMNS